MFLSSPAPRLQVAIGTQNSEMKRAVSNSLLARSPVGLFAPSLLNDRLLGGDLYIGDNVGVADL